MARTKCIYCDNPQYLEGERVMNMGMKVSKKIMELSANALGLLHGVHGGGAVGKALFLAEITAFEKLHGVGTYHFYCPKCNQDFVKQVPTK
jgi:predicted nucleic-acid-binding Zn-ribbon protein